MGTDNYCLRWNDFESSVSGSFRELRAEQDFFDVTLVTDSKHFSAHKVILSACSAFFKRTLRQTAKEMNGTLGKPVIYLRGIGSQEFSAILDFIYNGEVYVAQGELNSFLSVAEDLQIKGLTDKPSDKRKSESFKSHSASFCTTSSLGPPTKKIRRGDKVNKTQSIVSEVPQTSHSVHEEQKLYTEEEEGNEEEKDGEDDDDDDDDIKEIINVKPEIIESTRSLGESKGGIYKSEDSDPAAYEDEYGEDGVYYGDSSLMELEEDDGSAAASASTSSLNDSSSLPDNGKDRAVKRLKSGGGICLICCKKFSQMGNAYRHYNLLHLTSQTNVSCHVCSKVFKHSTYLDQHMRFFHGVYKREILMNPPSKRS